MRISLINLTSQVILWSRFDQLLIVLYMKIEVQEFVKIKRELFSIFSDTFQYNDKEMYLTNIVSDYTKKVIQSLNNPEKGFLSLGYELSIYTRMILMFDMPVETAEEKKAYRKFRAISD